MSNSSLVDVKISASTSNYTKGRSGYNIEMVAIHHMAGVLTAKQCGEIFKNGSRRASSNYGIGKDADVGLYVDEKNTSWCNGNWISNCKSVTIEVSNCEIGGDWKISELVLNKLIELVADIFKRNKLGKAVKGKNITWHSMYVNTTCPGEYLLSKMDYIVEKVNEKNGYALVETEKEIANVTVTSRIGLNLRKEPNTNSDILGVFAKGTTLKIYEIKNNWGRTQGGWVCLDYTSYNQNSSNKYSIGRYKVVCEVLTVRSGPGTNYSWKYYSELTSNAQSQVLALCGYKPNGLCRGVICDVTEINNGNWGKIPSRMGLFRLL